jgi:uncharacterized damage-inducible protein DinB
MVAYNHWANMRILDAASNLSPEAFAPLSEKLAHTAETLEFWLANWHGRVFDGYEGQFPLGEVKAMLDASDTALDAYAASLTEEEWNRTDAWWKRWGFEAKAPVGQTLFQVIYHGIQHRAEAAIVLSEHDASPGDLDYLQFLRHSADGDSGWPSE